MEIAAQAFGGLAIIGGIAITVLLSYHKQTPAVWTTFATIVCVGLMVCFLWQNSILEKERTATKKTAQTTKPQLEEPTFSEEVNEISVSLGSGITDSTDIAKLKEKPREPFSFGDFKPVKLYISGGKLYADVKIYGGKNLPPLEIKKNKIINKPHDWDFNSNKNALEIVNENQTPFYQFFYKTPSHIVLNGIFPFPGGLILANENRMVINPSLPTTFNLKPIFKYPSWKYPGEYKE